MEVNPLDNVEARPSRLNAAVAVSVALLSTVMGLCKVKDDNIVQAMLQAQQDGKTYDALNYRDDQFDLADAAISIAIALLAVASLTQLWWLYGIAMVPALFGTFMGIAGLAGWQVHPQALASLLS